jgi:1-acyl-sn-glycerol-3-phosphate acyltransferase
MEGKACKIMKKKKIIDFSLAFRIPSAFIYYITLFLVIIFNSVVYRVRITGRKNLRECSKRRCFLISNHSLYLDPALVAHAIAPSRIYFSALAETFDEVFIGPYIRFLGAFPIPVESGLLKILQPVHEGLLKGYYVHFFPEGNLKLYNTELQPFQSGVFYLSHLFSTPIVPVTIVRKIRIVFGIKLSERFSRIKLVIGEPIYPEPYFQQNISNKEAAVKMAEYARQSMQKTIQDNL